MIPMRLTVIGCGDAFGSGGRFNTCFMVEGTRHTILVDCGASTPVAMKMRGIGLNSIDGIVLSHLHCDHMMDACDYVIVRRYAPDGPYPPIPVYAPVDAPDAGMSFVFVFIQAHIIPVRRVRISGEVS